MAPRQYVIVWDGVYTNIVPSSDGISFADAKREVSMYMRTNRDAWIDAVRELRVLCESDLKATPNMKVLTLEAEVTP